MILKVLIFLLVGCVQIRAEFAIKDGDTVVFLGDSITAARQYGRVIEDYTLLRFPDRKVKFINAGKGGETAKGSLSRLDRAVFEQGATLVTVAYGVNDIGWGTKADETHEKEYLSAVEEIVSRCRTRGVRVFICSAAITAEDPDKAESGFLQRMCDKGLGLAKEHGAGTIDVQRTMRQIQRRVLVANAKQTEKSKPTKMHVEDGVHLNDLGQFAMAFAILKGLGAPADVSAATIDAQTATVTLTDSCKITGISNTNVGLSFVRSDERLPLNLAPLWMLQGMYIPISDELNRYLLTVLNLPNGSYEILAGGRLLGKWSAGELSRGVNLASATADPWQPGGLWDGQGQAVKIFTDMRDELASVRKGMGETLKAHPARQDLLAQADAIESNIVALQRATARPVPIEFVLRKLQ